MIRVRPPEPGRLAYEATVEGTTTGYHIEVRALSADAFAEQGHFTDPSRAGTSWTRALRWLPEGLHEVGVSTAWEWNGRQRTTEFVASPPRLVLPAEVSLGQRWDATGATETAGRIGLQPAPPTYSTVVTAIEPTSEWGAPSHLITVLEEQREGRPAQAAGVDPDQVTFSVRVHSPPRLDTCERVFLASPCLLIEERVRSTGNPVIHRRLVQRLP